MSDAPHSLVKWEQRWHPLREEWVIVAAHRQDRPWKGHPAATSHPAVPPAFDPGCHLCPGNRRINGARNPDYAGVYVFDNDLPCVGPAAPPDPAAPVDPRGVYRTRPADGIARVVCYTPLHHTSLSQLSLEQVSTLLQAWQAQYRELGGHPQVNHVLVFENRGEVVGVSNPHPHGQIYATNFVFTTIEKEVRIGERHLRETGRVLMQDILAAELADGRRVLAANDGALAFLPYFARYAYEVYVMPRRTAPSVADLRDDEVSDLAAVLREVLVRYDNLWRMPFPYVMALHQAPTDGRTYPGFHFHIELHPPLRKPNLLKYLAGPEIGGGSFLSDTWPEDKAAELRAVRGDHHYCATSGKGDHDA